MDKIRTVLFVSSIVFPNYNGFWFILYMYLKYYSVFKRGFTYQIKTISDSVMLNLMRNNPRHYYDNNNTVIVHPDRIYETDKILLLTHEHCNLSRLVFVKTELTCRKDVLYISNTLFYNIINSCDFDIKLTKPLYDVNIAQQIELSLIASSPDIRNALIDVIVKNYFKIPKLICKDDIITIDIKNFASDFFYFDSKINCIEKIYFKCNKVIFDNKEQLGCHLCVIGETTIKQAANIQSFVPRSLTEGTRKVSSKVLSEVFSYLHYLEVYLEIEDAAQVFLDVDQLGTYQLNPVFLIEGDEGSGIEMMLSYLASGLGMHYFPINSSDLMANVYAQYESKINKLFFNAKMSAPCLVAIFSFQNLNKNNEGQYDERLINSFAKYLLTLFENNSYPVILFCCSNNDDIPLELKRIFLEVFKINSPTDLERADILKWILEKNDISIEGFDLKSIANKTHGFYFENLKALVYYAENHFLQINDNRKDVVLKEDDFLYAIDFMQSNYNESIGAPKVPKVLWSDVGGLKDVKDEIIKSINLPLKHADLFINSGLSRSGILLFGPPGTGKTLIAKAVATECSLCFLTVKGPELLNMYVGQSEQNVREVFERARQASPCIIFFDELDSLAPNRGVSGDSGGVMDRVVSQLLAEMDGLENNGKVFVIGATNRPDLIDPALLRPGRFDKLLYVGPCTDLPSKISVLKSLTRKFKLADDIDLVQIVNMCPQNITGADFYGICSNAWSSAAKRLIETLNNDGLDAGNFTQGDVIVNTQDFTFAVKNVKPSVSKEDLTYFKNLKKELSSNM